MCIRDSFQDIGQDPNNHDVTFENTQARVRTLVLMNLANQNNGLVIGTGDLSELALGWATYNGDHMSKMCIRDSDHGIYVNDKRVLRICRAKDIRSTVKYNNRGCTRRAKNPKYLAENLLNRQFYAEKPNEKWLTDVTEFKWYDGMEVHKLYLSAILDLCDRRIVSYVLSERNDNPLVYKTFDKAVKANPDAHPLFHSDRGFQYTGRAFHHKLVQAGMTQSMSRVAHCIDNGPMEGFWGILKRERYYGKRFTSKQELVQMIECYIRYYNTRRVQRNLGVLTPIEKHKLCLAA